MQGQGEWEEGNHLMMHPEPAELPQILCWKGKRRSLGSVIGHGFGENECYSEDDT